MVNNKERIIVIDFGSQYAHLIANKIRKLNVFSEIRDPQTQLKEIAGAKGIIFSGSPYGVYQKGAPKVDPKIFRLDIPILGLCYGHQLMAKELGGKVEKGKIREFGKAFLKIISPDYLLKGLKRREIVWMSHGDKASKLPPGFKILGSTRDCKIVAMADLKRRFFGLQFHPEVTHTPAGLKILENFLNLCGCKRNWTIANFIPEICQEIKEKAGKKKVFLLVSGGVDSTVTLALLNRALGQKRVFAFYVDSGLGRKNEPQDIKKALTKIGFNNLKIIPASEIFLKSLEKTIHPEKKREIIGNLFIQIWQRKLKEMRVNSENWILAQGTIYPDTIETGKTRFADRIKTHHNRVAAVRKLIAKGKLIEPLKELYKDEVRRLGEKLGLPKEIILRHPFPGPGLAVRILCQKKKEKINLNLQRKIGRFCQSFLEEENILPLRSVGVQGDQRTFAFPLAVKGKNDWSFLENISSKITNHFREINRVVLLLTPQDKSLKELKPKKAHLTKERIKISQEADFIVNETIKKENLTAKIWQFPVVLLPISFTGGGESIVLRPVWSENGMTAEFAKLPFKIINQISLELMRLKGVEAVFYDITNKPPGTIEWE